MQAQSNDSLADFMRSKFREKSDKNNNKSDFHLKPSQELVDNSDLIEILDEENEEEKQKKELEKAKRESNLKAANYSKIAMYKKLIGQCLLGYLAMMIAMIIICMASIMLGPAVMSFFQLIINKLVIYGLGQ